MMTVVLSLLFFAFYFIRTVRALCFHLAWWEIKEYRLDRMLVHLRETYQGRQWLLDPISLVKWFLLLSYFLVPSEFFPFKLFSVIVIAMYLIEGTFNIIELKNGWKIPPLRIRIGAIWFATLLILTLLLYIPFPRPVVFLLIDKAIGISIALFIFLTNVVFKLHKKQVMARARQKISRYKNLEVVGITGSYGKTSTKEFVASVLEHKFTVVKTLASQNTDIGIAERILKADLKNCDIFVCEMAAYHPGEIASSCSLFGNKIKVAVLTGVNEQHQSLFGSIETTMKSKFELSNAVASGGTALFNGENARAREMSKWNTSNKIYKVIVNKSHIDKLPKNVHGSHFKENLSLAYAAAQALGMKNKEIDEAVAGVTLPPKTMDTERRGNVLVINDTFNANPDAVYAALDYLKRQKGKKVLVLQPLIELGSYASEVHAKIGKMAVEMCDHVILANKNFNKPFFEGASLVKGGLSKVSVMGKLPTIKEGVILFEGKEAEKYLKELSHE